MSQPGRVITVSRDQVSAARALVRLRGGVDNVDPVIAKIASALPGRSSESQGYQGSGLIGSDSRRVKAS